MRSRYIFLMLIQITMTIVSCCYAAEKTKKEPISIDSITKSINYVHDAFKGNYGDDPIFEGNNTVGSFKFEGAKVFINFRGSLGLEFVPLITNRALTDAAVIGIKGQVNGGALKSALSLKTPVITRLTDYCSKNTLTMDNLQIVLGGYSRGSTLATLLAPALLEAKVKDVRCITYGTLNVFDSVAASSYDNLLGKDNYLGFIAEEDLSRRFFSSFSSVGNMTHFSATDSTSYNTRLQNSAFSYLMKPLGVIGIKAVGININSWEAHMPETYLEMIPTLVRKNKSI